jgi:hypothetical protein
MMNPKPSPEERCYSEWFPRPLSVRPPIEPEDFHFDPDEGRVSFSIRDSEGVLHVGALRVIRGDDQEGEE